MNDVQEQLKNFIVSEFALEQNSINVDDDLLNQGILDSMGVLQLVNFMEEKFGISVADEEIVPDNFRSLTTLADFIQRKNGSQ